MRRFSVGDRVRIDIPDETDLDHERFHGRHGTVEKVLDDDAGDVTGDSRDSTIYRVQFEGDLEEDFRWRDLRPPME